MWHVYSIARGNRNTSPEGIETHLQNCSTLQVQMADALQSGGASSSMTLDDADVGVGTLVSFSLPSIVVEKLPNQYAQLSTRGGEPSLETGVLQEYKSEKKVQLSRDLSRTSLAETNIPTPRRSSLRALQKLRQFSAVLSADDDQPEDSDDVKQEENLDKDFVPLSKRPYFEPRKKKSRHIRSNNNSRRVSDDMYVHRCTVCPTKFRSDKEFAWHMHNIHGEGSKNFEIITCPICGRMLNKRLVFLSHLKSHENAEALEDAFNIWNTWPHAKAKTNKPMKFNCKYCLIPHLSQHSFLTHMQNEHPEEGRFPKYLCSYCKTSEFDSMKKLLTHFRTVHQEDLYGKTIKWTFSNPLEQEGRPKGQCDICNKLFDVFYLRTHKERMHFNKDTRKNNGRGIPENWTEETFTCPVEDCHSIFKSRSLLKSHFILHLENNPFCCTFPGCNVKCDAQCHLNRHMKLHTSLLPVTCPKCKVAYSRKDKLRKHVCSSDPKKIMVDENGQLRHVNSLLRVRRLKIRKQEISEDAEKHHKDEEQRKYNRRVNINAIILSDPVFLKVCKRNPEFKKLIIQRSFDKPLKNRGPNTYKCLDCSTVFMDKGGLKKHSSMCAGKVVTKTENNAQKPEEIEVNSPVGCPICGISLPTASLLENHVEADHDPSEVQKCETCQIFFSSQRVQQYHLQKMHSATPHKCPSCNKFYTTVQELSTHRETQCSGPRKCSKCGKILVNSASLARHWLLIHGVKLLPVSKTNNHLKRVKSKYRKRRAQGKSKATHSTKITPKKNEDSESAYRNPEPDWGIVKIETESEMTVSNCDTKMETFMVKVEPPVVKTEPMDYHQE